MGPWPPTARPPIELDTARLRLRQWRDDDLAPLAAMNADPSVMAHFPSTLDRAASDACARRWQAEIADRGWGLWAAERRADGAFVGLVGLQVPTVPLPFAPCVEVGWRLARAWWGHGYATEGARAALACGFERLGLDEIVCFTAVGNLRSRAVMARLGMVQDAATFEHPSVPAGSPLREHCLFRLTRASHEARATRSR